MSTECKPYVEFAAGNLITAEGMNEMQELICDDIHKHVDEGIASITNVETAENAKMLDGKTVQELCEEWLEKALQAIPKRSGYLKLFKRLKPNNLVAIEHNLKTCPVVDLYQLLSFPVVCAVDDDKSASRAFFFLYHTSEKKIKSPDPSSTDPVVIEDGDLPVQFKMPLMDVLEMYDVPYTNDSSLGDLETELWKAMFSAPNDEFDMEDYCHSPWFERCCREERTVESMKKKGDWDDLWLKTCTRKTVNFPSQNQGSMSPLDLHVAHFNMNTIGLMWEPVMADNGTPIDPDGNPLDDKGHNDGSNANRDDSGMEEQRLMVILKV